RHQAPGGTGGLPSCPTAPPPGAWWRISASSPWTPCFYHAFFFFLLSGVSTLIGMELRRGAVGAVSPAPVRRETERHLNRALSLASLSVAVGAILLGGAFFFFFPRFNAGYLGRASL